MITIEKTARLEHEQFLCGVRFDGIDVLNCFDTGQGVWVLIHVPKRVLFVLVPVPRHVDMGIYKVSAVNVYEPHRVDGNLRSIWCSQ